MIILRIILFVNGQLWPPFSSGCVFQIPLNTPRVSWARILSEVVGLLVGGGQLLYKLSLSILIAVKS